MPAQSGAKVAENQDGSMCDTNGTYPLDNPVTYPIYAAGGWVLGTLLFVFAVGGSIVLIKNRHIQPAKARQLPIVLFSVWGMAIVGIWRGAAEAIVGPTNFPCDANYMLSVHS